MAGFRQTCKKNPGDHPWHHHDEDGEDFQRAGHQRSSLSMTQRFCSKCSLNYDLRESYEKQSISSGEAPT